VKLPAWMHSLRFRLAVMYTLLALALVTLVGAVMTVQLLRDLDGQFVATLNERADRLAQRLNDPRAGLGETLVAPTGSYVMLVDGLGRVTYGTPGVQDFQKAPFPFAGQSVVKLAQGQVRVATRPWTGHGKGAFIWVALSEDTLIQARTSAMRLLTFAVIGTPFLTLLLAWFAGQRALRGLGQAARLAGRINPSSSVAALPLPRRQDEVYELLTAINLLLSRIETQQSREKQLLGQIVHELGAPLTVLRASLSKAASVGSDPDVRRAALVADELTFTTQDLMQLARGQLEMRLAYHYIPAQQLRERLDRLVPGVQFMGDWKAFVLCDPDRLTQALRNLLANGRRAAGPEGHVELRLEESPEAVRFIARDSGQGLPPELGERIFDPFVSGAGSSGLGLSVSRQIARMHGGELMGGNWRHENGETGGAEFILNLPGLEIGDDSDADLPELDLNEAPLALPGPRPGPVHARPSYASSESSVKVRP
jgi:signal transduction histidine kinase